MNKKWLDLRPSARRFYSAAVWIPLSAGSTQSAGQHGRPGYWNIYEGAHAIAVPLTLREEGERYSWGDQGDAQPWARPGYYRPADVWGPSDTLDVGIRLALRQGFSDREAVWHLHQDVILALRLAQEGDSWVRPEEDYAIVARLKRSEDLVVGIEIKSEYLRDYLCARECALRIASYRERIAIVDELGDIDFPEAGSAESFEGGRLEERAWPVDIGGSPFGSKTAVFRMSRNDVDLEAEVPVMGPESNDNVDSEHWTIDHTDEKVFYASSAFWRDEWLEPAAASPRVRDDDVPSAVEFIVEADGTRRNADDLNNEDVGQWLWFSPGIVAALLARRGAVLEWYTRDTGGISTPTDPSVHFGLNQSGLVNAYAYDVARLPEWEKRLWAGYNVSPEGGISGELLSAQVHARVADSHAPEPFFSLGLKSLQAAWSARYGSRLLRAHDQEDDIRARVHRFRALDTPGLLALAKDVARLTADSLDISVMNAAVPPPAKEKSGSLKSLERVLSSLSDETLARAIMAPLFAVYDLRLSDAHLPRSDLLAAYKRLGIAESDSTLRAGLKMLHAVVSALYGCSRILQPTAQGASPGGVE